MSGRGRNIERLATRFREELIGERRRHAVEGGVATSFDEQLHELVERQASILPEADRRATEERVRRDTVGLGKLEDLLADTGVDEVLVNGHSSVYVERHGRLEPTSLRFESEEELRDMIERILAPVGRRVDELQPMVDARLPDGSRVNVVIPPLAVDGPLVSIRRFGRNQPNLEEMIEAGSIARPVAEALATAVGQRRSILISGGTGAGKTTLLNALSAHIPSEERVVTIEDAAELRLPRAHVVRLESRPATVEGRGEVGIRDLLRNALRMRPDRIVLGEVRGPEALDLLTALNTGHEGALSTVHANSCDDAIRRLEVLCLMAGVDLPHEAIGEQLGRGLDLVVQLERRSDGARRVVDLAEVVATANGIEARSLKGMCGPAEPEVPVTDASASTGNRS